MHGGGKRTGTGAPNGNFYAFPSGNDSSRKLAVYLVLIDHRDRRILARHLDEHGSFPPPRALQQRPPPRRRLHLSRVV